MSHSILLPEAGPGAVDSEFSPADPRCQGLLERVSVCLTEAHAHSGPVVVYPGLRGDALSVRPLLRLCRRLGYVANDWGRGMNLGPGDDVDAYLARMAVELRLVAASAGSPVSLLGWGLGGLYAQELARLAPETTSRVIAVAASAHGPRAGFGVRWLLAWAARTGRTDVRALLARLRRPLRLPMTYLCADRAGGVTQHHAFI